MEIIMDLIECIKKKWFCQHQWVLFKEIHVDNTGPDHDGSKYQVWHFYCKKCGKFKKIKSI